MQDDLTEATSTPADDSVRADLEAALGDWDGSTESVSPETPTEPAAKAEGDKPADESQEQQKPVSERQRDEKGRFVAKDGSQTEQPTDPATETPSTDAQQEAQSTETPAETAPTVEGAPPPGWSIASKAAWDALPAHIRADVIKREAEVNNGFAKLRDYKGLDQYAQMAKSSGTTLENALQNYVGMEQLLRRDFRQGIIAIAQNMGITQDKFQELFGSAPAGQPHQPGQQNGAGQSDPGQDLDDPYVKAAVEAALRPLNQQLTSLKSDIDNRTAAEKQRQVNAIQAIVDEFKAAPDYRYFSDVEERINDLFAKGMVPLTGDYRRDLATAYDMACQLNPEVREALFNERVSKTEEKRRAEAEKAEADKRAKAEAAKRAAVSVVGAPNGAASTPAGSKGSVRDDLAAAWDAHL